MIDEKLISAHQWVVDTSEKKPEWWAENLAWAYVAFGVIGYFLLKSTDSNPFSAYIFWTGLLLIAGAMMVVFARTPALFAMMGTKKIMRVLFGADLVFRIVMFFSHPEHWRAAYMINSALLVSYCYFSACQAPRPRHRRRAVVQSGTA